MPLIGLLVGIWMSLFGADPVLRTGMTYVEFHTACSEAALVIRPRHVITIPSQHGIRSVCRIIDRKGEHIAEFVNDKLSKIVVAPVVERGATITVTDVLDHISSANGVEAADILDIVNSRDALAHKEYERKMDPLPIPSILLEKAEKTTERVRQFNEALDQFDGGKLELGVTVEQATAAIGRDPIEIRDIGSGMAIVRYHTNDVPRSPKIVILTVASRATVICTDFDADWLTSLFESK